MHWGYTNKIVCHPGISKTLFVVQQGFFFPKMCSDVNNHVNAFSACASNKVSHQRPSGELRPLPIPQPPLSHISMDFVTGLPPSNSNIVMTVVDRLSKMVNFNALPKLPSAKGTTEVGHLMLSGSMVFRSTLSLTEDLSSCLGSGKGLQSERLNQELETGHRITASQNPDTWSHKLVWVEFTHNTVPSTSTGFSPFNVVHVFQPSLWSPQSLPHWPW